MISVTFDFLITSLKDRVVATTTIIIPSFNGLVNCLINNEKSINVLLKIATNGLVFLTAAAGLIYAIYKFKKLKDS